MHETPFETRYAEYDAWFDANANVFASELLAIRQILPEPGRWVEIGVGSGRFASALEIDTGVEPAEGIAGLARARGIEVLNGVAEDLPLADRSMDAVFLITTLCFLDDMARAFTEVTRVLVAGGTAIVAFIPSDSPFGRMYTGAAAQDPFFRQAILRPRAAVVAALSAAGLHLECSTCTLMADPVAANDRVETPAEGWERGSFVALRAIKPAFSGHS